MSAVGASAGFGDFVLAQREQILQSWIAAVDKHPSISTSDNLTCTQLLDHLPELCTELAALLKQPDAREIKREAKQDARAHGWKRWRQGYKLEELIREICLIRRDFVVPGLKPSPLRTHVLTPMHKMPRGELSKDFSTTSLLKQPSNSLRNIKKLCVSCPPN